MNQDFPNCNPRNQWTSHQIIDQTHQGTPVCKFEHPANWRVNSQVEWSFAHYSHPCLVFAETSNPNGLERFEFLPTESFYWLEPNWGNPIGQNKFGQTCLPPTAAGETMTRWVLPKYRGNRQNMRVVDMQNVPDLPQLLGDNNYQNIRHESVMVRIDYVENGREFEEEFYGVQVIHNPPNQGGYASMVQTNWGFARLFCFRTEKGKLDETRANFQKIATSTKTNPNWENLHGQVLQHLNTEFNRYIQMGYDQINAATQMSQMYLSQHRASVQQQQDNFNSNWQAWDDKRHQERAAWNNWENKIDDFGDAMMGRETVLDPYQQREIKIDGYHDRIFSDQQGNYLGVNDANFDPNVNADRSWIELKKK